ncbi:MAG: hypothetical protein ABIX12_15595, partial [Rubrivivax sp.]
EGHTMSEPLVEKVEKTDLEKSRDRITQLKEMVHYAKSNIEKLTEVWLALDGELKQKALAARMEPLLTLQNRFHDDLDAVIGEFEAVCAGMEGKPG